jgi:hypothetical protein
MTLNEVLLSLLEPLGETGKAHLVGDDTIQQWPPNSLGKLLEAGILSAAAPAQSIECHGCEHRCFMDVHHLPGIDARPSRAFVVCDVPEKQEQMGRIPVPEDRLKQWKVTPAQIALAVAELLATESKVEDRHGKSNIRIGLLKHKKGRRWVSLNKSPLTLEVNGHHLPVSEALYFDSGVIAIDSDRIASLIDKTPKGAKEYAPTTDKREARKRKTEARYEDWQEEYRKLKKANPGKSDTWCSLQIAKMPISDGKSAERIRRMMKK